MIFIRIFYKLLSEKQKKTTYVLMFAMLIGMFLEVMSVGMIIPILGVMSQDDYSNILQHLGSIGEVLNNYKQDEIIFIFLFVLFIIYLFKNIYLAFLVRFQTSFVFNFQKDLSNRLFLII